MTSNYEPDEGNYEARGREPGPQGPTGGRPSPSSDNNGEFGDIRIATGGKSVYVSLELVVYLVAVIGVFISSIVVDEYDGFGFGASEAWLYVTLLTVGYLISRGLAKSGGRGR